MESARPEVSEVQAAAGRRSRRARWEWRKSLVQVMKVWEAVRARLRMWVKMRVEMALGVG